MDPLELEYESMSAIPEGFASLYAEQDGKAVLTGINGMKTAQDVTNVQEALRKEREDHTATRNALKPWKDLDHAKTMAALDRIPGLEAAAEGKIDEAKIEDIINQRKPQIVGPLERSINELTENNATLTEENTALKATIEKRDLGDAIRGVATEMKVIPEAIADVEMVAAQYLEKTADGTFVVKADAQGFTPGLDVKSFLKEMQKVRPYWWPNSTGGGAGGGAGGPGSQNPFSAEHWDMGAQGKILREQGREVADRMAKSAGTTVGGLKPKAK